MLGILICLKLKCVKKRLSCRAVTETAMFLGVLVYNIKCMLINNLAYKYITRPLRRICSCSVVSTSVITTLLQLLSFSCFVTAALLQLLCYSCFVTAVLLQLLCYSHFVIAVLLELFSGLIADIYLR